MRIAINTRFLLKDKLEGIGIYTQEIFKRVVQLMPEHDFFFLFDRTYDASFIFSDNVTPVVIAPPARHPLLWYWWFEHSVPKTLREYQIDLFISPDGFASLNTSVPQLVTIHDLAFEHYKEHTPFLVYHYYKHYVPKYCHTAEKIVSVSAFTQQNIISHYGIQQDKTDIVYNAFEMLPADKDKTILSKYHLQDIPYFIFIGAVHPRKNVLNLLKAFELFRSTYQHTHKLVIIGRKAWMNEELNSFYRNMQYRHEVVWIEYIPRVDMIQVLQQAFAMVYPSLLEGFGIPVLEAMSLSVPVIVSDTSSLPEVAGDAGLYISPEHPEQISDAMHRLADDSILRNSLIEKGLKRASHFSWDASARKMADIIQAMLIKK